MSIVGHWDNLTEAQKLVQHDLLLAGVVEEIIEYGQLIPQLPVFGIDAKNIVYRREKTLPTGDFFAINEQLSWSANVDYDDVSLELKRIYTQRVLDHFMAKNYRNPNDYKAQVLSECGKGVLRTVEDKLIYGNATTSPKEFHGLINLVDSGMRAQNADSGLELSKLRVALDAVRPEASFILMPFQIQRRMDAAMWEAGIANSLIRVQESSTGLGKRVTYFDGVPIIPTDFLVQEAADGTGKEAASGYYSVYVVRTGQLMDGGVSMAVGAETGKPNMFRIVELDNLEDYDAAGLRLVAYMALGLGSTKSLYQIYRVKDEAVVA